ncbi:MAG: hypothetical protein IIA11_05610 [Proteobacteria bacterium]|nr:hypothetical protein [Pseudomonadota bacterium]
MRFLTTMLLTGVLATLPVTTQAFEIEQTLRELSSHFHDCDQQHFQIAQKSGGMSLAEAIESVRRKTNGRIVSAATKVSGGREVHHIKVLTKDGKVRTHKVPGRKR